MPVGGFRSWKYRRQGPRRVEEGGHCRVLYLSYDGLLEAIGQSQILPYLERLRGRSVDITLVTFEKAEDLAPESATYEATLTRLATARIRWIPLRYHKRPAVLSTLYDTLYGAMWTLRLVRRFGAQLVHVRSYVPAVMALPARWFLRCPVIFDIRGFWVDERVDGGLWRDGLLYRIAKRVERLLYCNVDAIVSLTEAGKLTIQDFSTVTSRRVPIVVIPTCVDTDSFAPKHPDRTLVERLGYDGKTVFAYVGSVGTWYAMEETLDFFEVALQEIPTATFLLIVRGPVNALRESVERRELRTVTTFVPSVPNGEVPKWLSIAHVGVAFYRRGLSNVARFPTKIGEYLASGLPVVVSGGVGDCDGLIEAGRVGVSVGEFTISEYRRAARLLRELLQDQSLSNRCRNIALRRLSIAEGVERYHSVYAHVMGERGLWVHTG